MISRFTGQVWAPSSQQGQHVWQVDTATGPANVSDILKRLGLLVLAPACLVTPADPDNRLLWRMNRGRLDAEAICLDSHAASNLHRPHHVYHGDLIPGLT